MKVEDSASIMVAKDVDHPVTLVVATYRDVDNMTTLGKRSVVVSYKFPLRTALLEQANHPGTDAMGGASPVDKPSTVGAAENIDRRHVHAGLLEIAYDSLEFV